MWFSTKAMDFEWPWSRNLRTVQPFSTPKSNSRHFLPSHAGELFFHLLQCQSAIFWHLTGKKNWTSNSCVGNIWHKLIQLVRGQCLKFKGFKGNSPVSNGSSRGTDGPAASSQSPAAPSVLPVVPPAATPPGNNGWGWSNPRTDRQRGQPNENQNQTKNGAESTKTNTNNLMQSTWVNKALLRLTVHRSSLFSPNPLSGCGSAL